MMSLAVLLIAQFDIAQKMKFSIKDFCSKCDQIRSFLRINKQLGILMLITYSFLNIFSSSQ